jgi:hypothetical protein
LLQIHIAVPRWCLRCNGKRAVEMARMSQSTAFNERQRHHLSDRHVYHLTYIGHSRRRGRQTTITPVCWRAGSVSRQGWYFDATSTESDKAHASAHVSFGSLPVRWHCWYICNPMLLRWQRDRQQWHNAEDSGAKGGSDAERE